MRKNGFTLIELLAVIVILAIIALIATPIILGIINDAREKANERSVELYASAVKNAMAAYQLTNANAPESFSDLSVQYDGNVECTVKELYADGSFYLEGCKVNKGEKEYSYGTKQGSSFEVGKMSICNPLNIQTEGTYTVGDKYECDVDPNKEGYDYIFYVLNADTTSVNLIMDSNINKSGEAVKEGIADKGTVAWITKEDYLKPSTGGIETEWENEFGNANKGPITAMNYLQKATAGWSNVNPQTINTFTDEEDNTYPMTEYVVNARMPYLYEIKMGYKPQANEVWFLYNNLRAECWDAERNYYASCDMAPNISSISGVHVEGMTHVAEIIGYWLLTFIPNEFEPFDYAMAFDSSGLPESGRIRANNGGSYGVRPVINLSI